MAPTSKVPVKKATFAKGVAKKNAKPGKSRFIKRKNAKPAFKKKVEDLSESDFDSDDDLGMNGPEYGPLSDGTSSDASNPEGGIDSIPMAVEVSASSDSEDTGDDSQAEDSDAEDGSSSGEEVPEPEGSVEGDSSDEETTVKSKKPKLDENTEKRTIFVGNLPLTAKKMKLKKWFSRFGTVETVRFRCTPVANPDVPRKVSAKQKDFHPSRTNTSAFVRFTEEEAVTRALEANGAAWSEQHHIRVDRCAAGRAHDDKKSVFIGNLPFDAEEEQIRQIFVDCGDVVGIRIVRDRRTNVGKGFAYVNFAERHSVPLALAKAGETVGKRPIRVARCNYEKSKTCGPPDQRAKSGKFLEKRKAFVKKTFGKKNPNAPIKEKPSFQGEQAKKREKKTKRKIALSQKKKQAFIETLNSKPKKPNSS